MPVSLTFTGFAYTNASSTFVNGVSVTPTNIVGGSHTLSGSGSAFSVGGTVSLDGISGYTFRGYTNGSKYPVVSRYGYAFIIGATSTSTYTLVAASLACYLRGTMILTAEGEKPVEALCEGELIPTRFGGLRPLRWLGQSRLHASSLAAGKMPVCIAAGAMGDGVPKRDLWVTG